MSNKNDDLMRKRSDLYHKHTVKLNERNADNSKIGGKILSEVEISREASLLADLKMKEQAELDKIFPKPKERETEKDKIVVRENVQQAERPKRKNIFKKQNQNNRDMGRTQ